MNQLAALPLHCTAYFSHRDVSSRTSLHKEAVSSIAGILDTLDIECHAVHKNSHGKAGKSPGPDDEALRACEALQSVIGELRQNLVRRPDNVGEAMKLLHLPEEASTSASAPTSVAMSNANADIVSKVTDFENCKRKSL